MASMADLSVYTLPPSAANFDQVGIFYVAFAATWSTVVFAGLGFLWANRQNPIVKIRGLGLSTAAIAMLHAYWVLAQVVYPVGQTMNLVLAYDIQYFFMGIWLPLGIALFHASNSRFLHVAEQQRQFTEAKLRKRSKCNGSQTSWLCRLRNMEYSIRILTYIGIGMVVQVLLTIGMWLCDRKYHPTFGIPGTEIRGSTIPEQVVDLGRGWEWWPTLLWQVVWTWIVAPILIWRSWGIRDTLGWRTQTIGCCLSSLHATPMFLIASYAPAFQPINAYFAPSEWINLSTMMFEVFTIFIPCWLVVRHRSLRNKAAASNAKWDTQSQISFLTATSLTATSSTDWKSPSLAEKGYGIYNLHSESGDRLLTLSALELVLSENPAPLQEFSALRDFSGENIAFLTRVASWRGSWPANPDEGQLRHTFTRALAIYTDFISPRDAEFPINVSSTDLKRLEAVFEEPARILCGEARVNPAIPFEVGRSLGSSRGDSGDSRAPSHDSGRVEIGAMANRIQYAGDISDDFDCTVFDDVQKHIKYLVLTNTWPKFVAETQQPRRRSGESERSDGTGSSRSSLKSRMAHLIHSFV